MCGIVGVVPRPDPRVPPDLSALVPAVEDAGRTLDAEVGAGVEAGRLVEAAAALESIDAELRGTSGVRALVAAPDRARELEARADGLLARLAAIEAEWDAVQDAALDPSGLEARSDALARLKDAVWAIRQDRLRTARAVAALAGPASDAAAIGAYHAIQLALSGIDRLEVRGRDSAGLHVLVRGDSLDAAAAQVRERAAERLDDRLFGNGSVRVAPGAWSFVYKAAAEIGELGDNTAGLRTTIAADDVLRLAVAAAGAEVIVLGHTRWASVGIISEANAHPLNHEEVAGEGPYVAGALNGDVDNYADLIAREQLRFPDEITTDAKVIPTLISRRLASGADLEEAFRATAAELEGSVAVAAVSAVAPDRLLLAQRGSGQALYLGLADHAFVVASEPYGLVETTSSYVRLDGETPADPDRPDATRGQIVVLDAARAGELAGITRYAYDGTPLPVEPTDVAHASITTRDVDRGDYPHYLLKEISESPTSFRKTLRGKLMTDERGSGRLRVVLGPDVLPDAVRAALGSGAIDRVTVIGQGTAAVAGSSLAAALNGLVDGRLRVEALPATELSGFGLRPDMSDTLVVAISQSGTTTDTNRTVDLVRDRGARVVAIVNRRNSDLTDKADGVLFTSDGRDVEMSVASTKAFYAQVAAGSLLAVAVAEAVGGVDPVLVQRRLQGLRALPDAMQAVVDARDAIAAVVGRHVLSRRHWAVVGNGVNAVAAQELRIKLSELCYKSIACDITEDKKHIDLSSEPLVLVCAGGLTGSNADDVAKEVAIYRAHRAAPIVIAADGARYGAALDVIEVPSVDPALDFVLTAVAGHLFGYEAALAIDASARPMREARAVIEAALGSGAPDLLDWLGPRLEPAARHVHETLRAGAYDGSLEASTATRLASLLRYATGLLPLAAYEIEHGKVGTPGAVVADLIAALSDGIDQLTRPIDAIKHQAKTVTVGISRSDETLLQAPLVRAVLAAGAPRDALSYRTLRTLVDLGPAVEEVTGFTRYRIEGDADRDRATIHVVDRGGIATGITSRTDADPRLTGTKHRVATQREVTAGRSRHDGRTVVFVPELKHDQAVGLTLLHVRFAAYLAPEAMRAVLLGYQGRYGALKDAVTEIRPSFDEAVLGQVEVADLLTEPVYVLAERWRGP